MTNVLSRRALLIAVVVLLCGVPTTACAQATFEAFSSERLTALQAEKKTVLVNVHADWCPTCRAQAGVLDVALIEPRYVGLAKLKLDWDDQRDAARALGAPRQSTLLLFRGGKRVALSVAETADVKLRAFLDKGVTDKASADKSPQPHPAK